MKEKKICILLTLIILFVIWFYPIDAVQVSLRLKDQNTFCDNEQIKIYFDHGDGINENDSVTGTFSEGNMMMKINPIFNQAVAVRIDFEGVSGRRTLSDLILFSGNFSDNDYKIGKITTEQLAAATETNDISDIEISDGGITFSVTGDDPYFLLDKNGVKAFRKGISNLWYFKLALTVIILAIAILIFAEIVLDGKKKNTYMRKRIIVFAVCSAVFQIFFVWYIIKNVSDIHLTDTTDFVNYSKEDNGCFHISKIKNGLQRLYLQVDEVDENNPLVAKTDVIHIRILSEDEAEVWGEKEIYKGKLSAPDSYEMTLEQWHSASGCIVEMTDTDGEDIGIIRISVKTSGKTLNRGHWLILFSLTCNLALMVVVLYEELFKNPKIALGFLYLLFFFMNCFKMWCYRMYVKGFPDEDYHIAYVAYLSKTGKIIPHFSDMRAIAIGESSAHFANVPRYNYLGHPPLYYHLLRLAQAVKFNGEQMTVNVERMRTFSNILALLGFSLIMYIGYTRIRNDRPYWHLFYLTGIFCIPMMTYSAAGVNNDVLTIIGCAVFFLGALRFTEKKRTYTTFFLIASGICLSMLGKLTAGCVLALTTVFFAMWYCLTQKKITDIFCKQFWTTLPIYFITLGYFVIIYLQTGSIQPRIKDMANGGDYKPKFFVEFENRSTIGIWEYLCRFIRKFMGQWTGIMSHITLTHMGGVDSIGFLLRISVWLLPILLFIFCIKRYRKEHILVVFQNSKEAFLGLAYIAVLLTIFIQLIRATGNFFYRTGYTGSNQSRYYLCIAVILIYFIVYLLEKYDNKIGKKLNWVLLLSAAYFMFSDFIYFLISYEGFRA